jgi:hypothetical protein
MLNVLRKTLAKHWRTVRKCTELLQASLAQLDSFRADLPLIRAASPVAIAAKIDERGGDSGGTLAMIDALDRFAEIES